MYDMYVHNDMPKQSQNPTNPVQFVRLITGLAQTEFAKVLGVSRSLLSKIEAGQVGYAEPSARVRRQIARKFGAILQPMGSIPPALDFDHQPFTTLSWQKHQQVTPKPLAEEYPIESLGLALAWVGSAGKIKRAPTEKMTRRNNLIKKVMSEHRLSLPQASKYIKEKKLEY